jgi:uncharacterized membrane protein
VNQQDFVNALYLELEKIPHADKEGIIAHYQEIFRIGLEQGQTEEEIAAHLGSPHTIADYYEAHHMIGLAELESSLRNLFLAVKAVLHLGISNLILILGPVLGVFGAMAALLAAGAAVSLAGLFLFGGVLVNLQQPGIIDIPPALYSDGLTAAATLCMSVGFISLGLLFLIGDYYLGRILYRGTLRHLDFHLRLTRKEDTYAQ